MKSDPMDGVRVTEIKRPPLVGRGSGRQAWIAYGFALAEANAAAWDIIEEQSAAIRDLKAEVALLKRQIATRKPKGGRPPVPDDTVARIEHELARGVGDRHVARLFHVSHMTVARIRRRMEARARLVEAGAPAA